MAAKSSVGSRRRANLSRDAILDATLAITGAGDQITFRALGAALDADPTAVYRHFRDKDELVRAAYDRMMVVARSQVDESASWRDQIFQLATLSWRSSEEHPHIGVHAPILTTGGPGELSCVDLILGKLREIGLDESQVVRFYGVIASYILSVSANISAQRLSALADDAPVSTAWLYDVHGIDAERYPAVAASRDALSTLTSGDVYRTGIEVLLDAAEAAANRR